MMTVLSSTAPWLGHDGMSAGENLNATALKAGVRVNLGFYDNLIKLYGRNCTCKEACVVYKNIEHKTVNSLNACLEAFCITGLGEEALTLCDERRNFSADIQTYITLMNCFAHCGLTDYGTELYKALKGNSKFVLPIKFYEVVIDLYSRAKMYDEAFKVIDEMDLEPNNVIWTTILAVATRNERNDIIDKIDRIIKNKMNKARDILDNYIGFHCHAINIKKEHHWKPIKMRFEHMMMVLSSCALWLGLDRVSVSENLNATGP
ncbi:hypothetical protein Q3G72_017663 [Acer saccharum]|nr:hypothetical protein Q3G72_017663 [Acer saccharum]